MQKTVVNVHEAKTHFSKLLARVERGERITVARAGKPVAKLVPAEIAPAGPLPEDDPLLNLDRFMVALLTRTRGIELGAGTLEVAVGL